jgi:hypothetical protein
MTMVAVAHRILILLLIVIFEPPEAGNKRSKLLMNEMLENYRFLLYQKITFSLFYVEH